MKNANVSQLEFMSKFKLNWPTSHVIQAAITKAFPQKLTLIVKNDTYHQIIQQLNHNSGY